VVGGGKRGGEEAAGPRGHFFKNKCGRAFFPVEVSRIMRVWWKTAAETCGDGSGRQVCLR
jgi:hypothetical protein